MMTPSAVSTEVATGALRDSSTRSGRNVQSAYMVKPTATDTAEREEKPANWNAPAPVSRKREREAEDGNTTPGPNTPATTNSGGTPSKREGGSTGCTEAPPAKKNRAIWSQEAIALGYETGTIKHSAYVLLASSGKNGMTVASIVETAQKQGLYSWGTCKTPNNSVTAALSQDTTFVRIAPSTYALRISLRASGAPMPAQRTSSGSINSAAEARGENSGSASGGAVAGGRSWSGSNANSKVRVEKEAPAPEKTDSQRNSREFSGGYANALAKQLGRTGSMGGKESAAQRLAAESYKRRMDVFGHQVDQQENAAEDTTAAPVVFPMPVRPAHSPDANSAGSCLFYYPTANPPPPKVEKPEPPKEPTEGLKRANSWKDEVKLLCAADEFKGIERTNSGHLPAWVLEQFKDKTSSGGGGSGLAVKAA